MVTRLGVMGACATWTVVALTAGCGGGKTGHSDGDADADADVDTDADADADSDTDSDSSGDCETGAASWTVDTVHGETDHAGYASIAFTPSGVAHVAYVVEPNVHHASNADGSWAREVVANDWGPLTIHSDSKGGLQMIWSNSTIRRATYATDSWAVETLRDLDPDSPVAFALDPEGHYHLAFVNTILEYATDLSGAWTYQEVVNSPPAGADPAIALGFDGVVHIAYAARSSHPHYLNDAAGDWPSELVWDGECFSPSIAVDDQDVVYVACTSETAPGSTELIVATRRSGAWSIEHVDPEGGGVPRIAVGPDGRVGVAYVASSIRYAFQTTTGWSIEVADESASEDIGLAFGDDGEPRVVYAPLTGGVFVATRSCPR